jgi:hypothetical protein
MQEHAFIKEYSLCCVLVSILIAEKKKSSTDFLIEKSFDLYGFTPMEKSDENLKWMRKNGYKIKNRHGTHGRPSKSKRF